MMEFLTYQSKTLTKDSIQIVELAEIMDTELWVSLPSPLRQMTTNSFLEHSKTSTKGLEKKLDVMRYLINNIWYWRARLVVESFSIDDEIVTFTVNNMGRASTQNATLQYIDGDKVLVGI